MVEMYVTENCKQSKK